ncbi:MAG: hypothetical protein RIC55_23695 [Pirellulaceae bacterium]
MDLFTNSDLQQLIDVQQSPCVSIYLPMHRTGREIREDALRYKNALKQAETALRDRGVRPGDVQEMLRPAQELAGSTDYLQRQSDGLAIFAAAGDFRAYRVPLSFEEMVVVGERFHLKPTLPLLEGDGQFYLLALSQNAVRLFQGSKFSISEVTPDTLPTSLRDALNIDQYVQSLQFYAYRRAGKPEAGTGDVMFHGQGGAGGEVEKNDEIRRFLQRVSAGLDDLLATSPRPLVFAGVEYLLPILRDTLKSSALLDEAVGGNPDELRGEKLHDEAWKIVRPMFQEQRRAKLDAYSQKLGTGYASNQLEEVLVATQQGAVDTLLLQERAHAWGHRDAERGRVELHDERRSGDQDLLDLAAVETLSNSGTVFTLAAEEMSGDSPIAALFRHPVARVG